MIPTGVLQAARRGFLLRRSPARVLSRRFGKRCLAVTTADGQRAQVRLVPESAATMPRLEAEMRWLSHLATAHALDVPAPRPWTDGRLVSPSLPDGRGGHWRAIACSWVPGRHLDAGLRARHMRRAGELLARLHLASADAPSGIVAARGRWDMPRLFAIAPQLPAVLAATSPTPAGMPGPWLAELTRACALLTDAWASLPDDAAHTGLIHTDAHWQNLRWTTHGVGMVDFEDVAEGRFMLDLACLATRIERHRNARRLTDAMLEGYDAVRSLPADAGRDLAIMRAFRRLDFAGWVLSWPRPDWQPWGPDFLAATPAYMTRWLTR